MRLYTWEAHVSSILSRRSHSWIASISKRVWETRNDERFNVKERHQLEDRPRNKRTETLVKWTFNDNPEEVHVDTLIRSYSLSVVVHAELSCSDIFDVDKNSETMLINFMLLVGDVLYKKPELTPIAINTGWIIARQLINIFDEIMDYNDGATTVISLLVNWSLCSSMLCPL